MTVSAEVDSDVITPTQANARVSNQLMPRMKKQFPGLQVRLAGAGLDQTRDLASLGQMMTIAMLVIFLLLASQLRTYTLPFVVLAGVPFGAAGAVIGHFILGYNISFISFRIVSGGVVVKLTGLVDQYNRRAGRKTPGSHRRAARRRFGAIF